MPDSKKPPATEISPTGRLRVDLPLRPFAKPLLEEDRRFWSELGHRLNRERVQLSVNYDAIEMRTMAALRHDLKAFLTGKIVARKSR